MQLPNFIQWKNLGAGEYVMGLEVSNSFLTVVIKNERRGVCPLLSQGNKEILLELGVVDGDAEMSALKAEIAGYR
ncbi:Uncharacterised protein [Shigella dysenteriae]|uniref:Uncharacterized protein n=1 Tax=Shigella dysenteriae TaxID=622 RepID=A0A3P6L3F2_SHIDY|nr:Uncharacterised protein [Shigella dysenteriae]